MTRQSRTLILVGVVAVVGVAALGWIANRYRQMAPPLSVADLEEPAAPSPLTLEEEEESEEAAAAESSSPAGTAGPTGPEAGEDAPVEPSPTEDPVVEQVDDFIAIRKTLLRGFEANPALSQRAVRTDLPRMGKETMALLAAVRVKKFGMLGDRDLPPEDYERIRRAFLSWREDEERVEDPSLRAAFEQRREELESADLGPFEDLDIDLTSR